MEKKQLNLLTARMPSGQHREEAEWFTGEGTGLDSTGSHPGTG